MRLKRQKVYKRQMALYTHSFGFRTPYQVILDGDFILTAQAQTISLRDQVPKVLLAPTKHLSTACVLSELRKMGEDASGAALAVKRMERRRCQHHPPISGADCIASIIGEENKHNYCVATQNTDLRDKLRATPGTPLLYINRAVLILERPSPATLRAVEEGEGKKRIASEKEQLRVEQILKSDAPVEEAVAEEEGAEKKDPVEKKRKAVHTPNPLSMKKKKVDKDLHAAKNRKKKELQKLKKYGGLPPKETTTQE